MYTAPLKFRAWDVEKEVMIYCNGTVRSDLADFFTQISQDWDNLVPVTSEGKLKDSDERFIPMQSTNLKDKNGKEIFGGDIVEIDKRLGKELYEIYYDLSLGFRLKDTKYDGELSLISPLSAITIIGNIFENPELIKK